MSESKMLKARCNKTGLLFGLELKKIGSAWKVVNVVRISNEEASIIASEVKQADFFTNENLLACRRCGNRRVSGCSCSRKNHPCSPTMKYCFDCVHCDSLSIDYSLPMRRSPYTKWAGISNIPEAIKDRYGNPSGSQYDLAQDGSFKGYVIVVLNLCSECDFSQPAIALRKKGFEIIEFKSAPSEQEMRKVLSGTKTQLWVISDRSPKLNEKHIDVITSFFNDGHGVYIWGDNDPYYVDANKILKHVFRTAMHGNSYGDRVLGVQSGSGTSGIIPNHPITTGITSFYEGITIAQVDITQSLKPLMYGSNGQVVTAYYDANGKRALIDGGFTRLYCKWDSAGTDRYIVNSAAWLANIEHFGYQ